MEIVKELVLLYGVVFIVLILATGIMLHQVITLSITHHYNELFKHVHTVLDRYEQIQRAQRPWPKYPPEDSKPTAEAAPKAKPDSPQEPTKREALEQLKTALQKKHEIDPETAQIRTIEYPSPAPEQDNSDDRFKPK